MSTQTLMRCFFLFGVAVSSILLPLIKFDYASATVDNSKTRKILTTDKNKLYKPSGISGDLEGGILLQEGEITSQDIKGFVVKSTGRINFVAQIWDPSVGKNNGDGIKSVQFQIFDENDINKLVHERIEKDPAYCPFGGGEPRCNIGQLARNHKYRVEITPTSKNPSLKKTFWFFHLQT